MSSDVERVLGDRKLTFVVACSSVFAHCDNCPQLLLSPRTEPHGARRPMLYAACASRLELDRMSVGGGAFFHDGL